MWDIKIGKPVQGVCSAIHCRDLAEGYSISSNSESFWVTEDFLGIGLKIYTGTVEYDMLRSMLKKDSADETIREWIDRLVIQYAPVTRMRAAITTRMQQSYQRGWRDAKAEIRRVLID